VELNTEMVFREERNTVPRYSPPVKPLVILPPWFSCITDLGCFLLTVPGFAEVCIFALHNFRRYSEQSRRQLLLWTRQSCDWPLVDREYLLPATAGTTGFHTLIRRKKKEPRQVAAGGGADAVVNSNHAAASEAEELAVAFSKCRLEEV
jgi:hypothetical protein